MPPPPPTVYLVTDIPLWVPLVVAGLGVLGAITGTIVGVLITQKHSDRREVQSWDRERERERERWAREDALRTFEQRQRAYVDFYESLRHMARTSYNHGMGLSEPDELDFEWSTAAYQGLEHFRLYASPEAMEAASAAYSACWRWGNQTTHGDDDERFYESQEDYDGAELRLYQCIRRDLGIVSSGPGDAPLPGSGWELAEDPSPSGTLPESEGART